MKLEEQDVRRRDLVNEFWARIRFCLSACADLVGKAAIITELESRKLHHDFYDIFTRAVQPILWLVIFGGVLGRLRVIPTGNLPYIDFMTPGILAQSVLFISIFYGISVIWERDLGVLHKLLVSPTYRASLVLGKAVAASERALTQAGVVYLLALLLGVNLNWNPIAILTVVFIIILGSALFSTFSLIIACLVKTRERFMGMGQVLTNPLFFASNAIYPISLMPGWLQLISRINPLTYEVDALRSLMIIGGPSTFGPVIDTAVLLMAIVILLTIASRIYPRIVT